MNGTANFGKADWIEAQRREKRSIIILLIRSFSAYNLGR
jgi:hypothetical protein